MSPRETYALAVEVIVGYERVCRIIEISRRSLMKGGSAQARAQALGGRLGGLAQSAIDGLNKSMGMIKRSTDAFEALDPRKAHAELAGLNIEGKDVDTLRAKLLELADVVELEGETVPAGATLH